MSRAHMTKETREYLEVAARDSKSSGRVTQLVEGGLMDGGRVTIHRGELFLQQYDGRLFPLTLHETVLALLSLGDRFGSAFPDGLEDFLVQSLGELEQASRARLRNDDRETETGTWLTRTEIHSRWPFLDRGTLFRFLVSVPIARGKYKIDERFIDWVNSEQMRLEWLAAAVERGDVGPHILSPHEELSRRIDAIETALNLNNPITQPTEHP